MKAIHYVFLKPLVPLKPLLRMKQPKGLVTIGQARGVNARMVDRKWL